MSAEGLTWEQAVAWLRSQPDQQELVQACYFDDPLLKAAQRFAASEEWQATRAFLPLQSGSAVLDLGAGRGISSYALAQEGFQVTALEPDNSDLVGAGAIRQLVEQMHLPIRVVQEFAERMPFPDQSYDIVYARQALHHAQDLPRLCQEVWRVLKPGGRFLAVREPVVKNSFELQQFLTNHPLHKLYGGEHAFRFTEYRQALKQAGFRIDRIIGPVESAINYAPLSRIEQEQVFYRSLQQLGGRTMAKHLWASSRLRSLISWGLRRALNYYSTTPGPIYSFITWKKA